MSENNRIRRSLQKLAGKQDDRIDREGKRIGGEGESLLAEILREADDTILERQLTVRLESGREFGLVLANRRLMRVYADAKAGLTSVANDALRSGIASDDKEALAALSQWFREVIGSAGSAHVRTGDVDASGLGQMVGVTVALLASEWAVALRPARRHSDLPDPADMVERFMACAPVAKSASLCAHDGKLTDMRGLSMDDLEAAKSRIGRTAAPSMTAIASKAQNVVMVYAVTGEHEMLIEANSADFPAISMSWDSLFQA